MAIKKLIKSISLSQEVINKVTKIATEGDNSFSSVVEQMLEGMPYENLKDKKQLPNIPCVYLVIDKNNKIQYIGRSINLNNRWCSHHRFSELKNQEEIKIAYIQVEDNETLPSIEQELITLFNPPLNGNVSEYSNRRILQCYTDKEIYEQIKKVATLERLSVSKLCELQIMKYVKEYLEEYEKGQLIKQQELRKLRGY